MNRAELISPEYLQTQIVLHAEPRGYGGKGDKWANGVHQIAADYDCGSILDYGCGRGMLAHALRGLGRPCREYDPAIPGKDGRPAFADLVVCTDVLEHIEPDKLDTVLAHLRGLARKACFVVIATRPSNKTLTDGRNAHLILEQAAWWEARVRAAGFEVHPGPASPLDKPSREWVAVLTP